jgi:putative membrane protein
MSPDKTPRGPVLFDLDDTGAMPGIGPSDAPPVPEPDLDLRPTDSAAMQRLAELAARPPNRLARWFWGLFSAVIGFFAVMAAWAAVSAVLAANPLLGSLAMALLVAFGIVCLLIAMREVRAFRRLARLDALQHEAATAVAEKDLMGARQVTSKLAALYAHRPELRWGHDRVMERIGDTFDADAALALAETELLVPLDTLAEREVQAAARRVATVTAVVPLALVDVFTALASNLRMIRSVAEIYGGRSGTLGTWRLTRAVLTHLVATGAVAVGDDMIGSIAGGSVLSKVSRRFGEGVVNGALTARVGVAAIEVCRPLAFTVQRRPSVSRLVRDALAGLFASGK